MSDQILSPKELRQLQKRYQKLQSEIAQLGWIAQGSLMHKEPNAWRLTRKIKAKTITMALSQAQASLFAQAIANHRRQLARKLLLVLSSRDHLAVDGRNRVRVFLRPLLLGAARAAEGENRA